MVRDAFPLPRIDEALQAVHSSSDNLVFSSSGVLFQAVGCDLEGEGREAVPVSETAIVPLQLQVSRHINW